MSCCCDTAFVPVYEPAPVYDPAPVDEAVPAYEPVYEAAPLDEPAPVYEAPATMTIGGHTEPDFTIVGGYEAPTSVTVGGHTEPAYGVVGGYEAPSVATVGGSWSPGPDVVTITDAAGNVVGGAQLGRPVTLEDIGLGGPVAPAPAAPLTDAHLQNQLANQIVTAPIVRHTMGHVDAVLSSMPGISHHDYSSATGITTVSYY